MHLIFWRRDARSELGTTALWSKAENGAILALEARIHLFTRLRVRLMDPRVEPEDDGGGVV
ncbi:hypothetical protein ASD74_19615 [Rhizobium sp. Root564]|nr:hypothetical protein ASD74_19615 [Rhizobium sp. Root564]